MLRVGELVRHALAALFARGEIEDEALAGAVITVPEVRMTPDLKWDMFWVPRLQTGATRKFRTGGSGVGVTKNARNPDLAWEWVKFTNTTPGYEIGAQHSAPTAVRLRAHVPSNAADVLWWPFHPEWSRIRGVAINEDLNAMLRGELPAPSTLKDVNERLTRELQAG